MRKSVERRLEGAYIPITLCDKDGSNCETVVLDYVIHEKGIRLIMGDKLNDKIIYLDLDSVVGR